MAKLHSINTEQGLFVLEASYGFSCLGFEVTQRRLESICHWLEKPVPPVSLGTQEQWDAYEAVMAEAGNLATKTNSRCPAELSEQLIGLEGKRVEVVDCHGEKRRFIVGRSSGWLPIHLEIKRRDSSGGMGVTGTPFRSVRVVS